MPKDALEEMHSNFILACGGSINAVKVAPKKEKKRATPTREITRELLGQKLSLAEMAKERNMTEGTIVSHLEQLAEEKKIDPFRDLDHLRSTYGSTFDHVHEAIRLCGSSPLKPVYEHLGGKISYETLRLARLLFDE